MIANPDVEFPQEDYIIKLVVKMEQDSTIAVSVSDIINSDGRHQNPQREAIFAKQVKFKNKKIYYMANLNVIHQHIESQKKDLQVQGCKFLSNIENVIYKIRVRI